MRGSDRTADRGGAADRERAADGDGDGARDGDESDDGADGEDGSSSRATCPNCGAGILLVTGVGPTEHYASPCGCRIDPRRVL